VTYNTRWRIIAEINRMLRDDPLTIAHYCSLVYFRNALLRRSLP
jgi:hypothetical protein